MRGEKLRDKKIVIVGAGPGGLTAGMLLAHAGFDVTVYEKERDVGGRNRSFSLDGFSFDIGPTFLMMKFILDEVFEESGHASDKHLTFTKLEPLYRLVFTDKTLDISNDHAAMKSALQETFPGIHMDYDHFLKSEKKRFDALFPCLKKDYSTFPRMFNPTLMKALPVLDLGKSLYQILGKYFKDPVGRVAFSFQSKYLGMSPWRCPGAFGIIPYIEHSMGIYHVEGGLSAISQAMAKILREEGGEILVETPVQEILIDNGRARGVKLSNGEKIDADHIVINADFGHAMTTLIPREHQGKFAREKLLRKEFSCSTYMMYLCLDTIYPLEHHTIVFAPDYRRNIEDITSGSVSPDNLSFYVRNSSRTDSTVAPDGKSGLYILVPVPNNKSDIDWEEFGPRLRESVIGGLKTRLGMENIEHHILNEKTITPRQWESDYSVFLGATFNLAHSLRQMLWFRPHNIFNDIPGCYLVGGGTHPGSGLPTIYESGRITAQAIRATYRQ